ncbi:MAG: serine/threonine protein kinase, partial [Candidatus Nanoarchaeia archaeon]
MTDQTSLTDITDTRVYAPDESDTLVDPPTSCAMEPVSTPISGVVNRYSHEGLERLQNPPSCYFDVIASKGIFGSPLSTSELCILDEVALKLMKQYNMPVIVQRQIGRGGMGSVYDVRIGGEQAALKIGRLRGDYVRRRFAREILIQKRSSQLIPTPEVIAHGQTNDADYGFLLMEYVPGKQFDTFLISADPKEKIERCRDLAQHLDTLHKEHIIHQDVKPSNIRANGHTYLLDFGLARRTTESDLKPKGAICGTPTYLAPECVLDNATVLSDQYSLGVTGHEAVFGVTPFEGSSMSDIMRKKMRPVKVGDA